MVSTLRLTLAGALAGSLALATVQQSWGAKFILQWFGIIWLAEFVPWMVWTILIYPHYVSPLRHLPQPGGNHWLWGHGMKILKERSGAPAKEWILTIPNDGLIRYLWFFNIERVLVTSPKVLGEVLVTNNYSFQKPQNIRDAIGRLLGFGILLTEGDEHRLQRRNLMPAFAFRHIKDLYPVFWAKSREVVQAMTATCNPDGATDMEIYEWASRCTLDIIGLAGMGRDFGAIKDENNPLVQTYQHVFRPSKQASSMAILSTFIPSALMNRIPIKRNDDINEAALKIRAVCRDMIREKKVKLANKEQPDLDILSVALESGHFSDENLVDQLMTFLAAGHETTATSMTWAIYMLCRYPEMQKTLRDEIREKLPSVDAEQDVTSLDIDHMPYLNAFCNEVLRYWSPVPQTIRETAHDTTVMGWPVRKGVRIILAASGINMSSELWGDDAHEFKPERWLAKDEGDKRAASGGATSNYAFLTFLHGPRSCIGQSFAKAEFACLLAAWVGRFEFEIKDEAMLDEDALDVKSGVTQRPANGLDVRTRVVEGY